MRVLQSSVSELRDSHDHGTPFSNTADDIPIDPALNELPLDPALLAASQHDVGVEVRLLRSSLQQRR